MYRKLCKYEFKSIARTLLPIYLAVVIVSLINAVSFSLNDLFGASGFFGAAGDGWLVGLMQLVMMLAYFGVMVALFVLTLVVILQRFYKGLLCSEGYLMFTLPVKPWQLIAAKGTAAFVISLISTAAAGISILLLVCGVYNPTEVLSTLLDPRVWAQAISELNRTFPKWGAYVLLYGVEILLLTIVSGMAALFQMYVSMALGHLAHKHRILMSVAAYLAISMLLSFISGAGMMVLDRMNLSVLFFGLSSDAAAQFVILSLLFWELLQLAAFFFGTERILSKKLNLE